MDIRPEPGRSQLDNSILPQSGLKSKDSTSKYGGSMTRSGRDWRSIESAPTDGTVILVFSRNNGQIEVASYQAGEWFSHETIHAPTHWMPLPEDPD